MALPVLLTLRRFQWIVRYMYVPMGGSDTAVGSVWIIFTFVGLWHDLIWRWMAWAWCNCVGLILEMGFVYLFAQHKSTAFLRRLPYWHHVKAAAGALNIFLLMLANLAILHGFADTPFFLRKAFWGEHGEGFSVFLASWGLMFIGVSFMNEIRRLEAFSANAKKY
jgi:membrane-bound O-acyltransferase GUP1_2